MKFTSKGYIKIIAELIQINEKDAVKIRIIDTGFGIKKEDQKNLFKLFTTLEQTKLLNKSGTGIGLHQSNKFAKKLGPDNSKGIEVTSELGKGSTFEFILENKENEISVNDFDEKRTPVVINSSHVKMLKERRKKQCCNKILIVDDEPFNIIALRALLSIFGFTCDATFDGEQALQMIRDRQESSCQCRYSLILLDCNMPIMNGYDACR